MPRDGQGVSRGRSDGFRPRADSARVDTSLPSSATALTRFSPPHRSPPANVSFVQGDFVRGLPFPSGQYDLVHCRFLVAGIRDFSALLDEIARCLRPGGMYAFCEPELGFDAANPGGLDAVPGIKAFCRNLVRCVALDWSWSNGAVPLVERTLTPRQPAAVASQPAVSAPISRGRSRGTLPRTHQSVPRRTPFSRTAYRSARGRATPLLAVSASSSYSTRWGFLMCVRVCMEQRGAAWQKADYIPHVCGRGPA